MISNCKNEKTYEAKYASFDAYPVYEKNDLGVQFSPTQTTFKLWSPNVENARLFLYDTDLGGDIRSTHAMEINEQGVWTAVVKENLEGKYYTFQIKRNDDWKNESADLYAVAAGRNGKRSQVVDLKKTNPIGWENDQRPPLARPNDIVLYELHVRDMSSAKSAGIKNVGKFLGLTETGTLSPEGLSTGIDHLKEMGITHLHLLPSFDFMSVNEEKSDTARKYNWGYDPHLYNVPEGSYATDAADGSVRIKEFKTMVKALHDAGIRVVLDVVYNHTGSKSRSPFDRLVPNYYFRQDSTGKKSNASGCGNETASERPMVRNFILNSVKYWAEEYHLDGFRFDLMGIHDLETMNQISETLRKIDPSIFVYGEGWTAGDSPLPLEKRALKANAPQLNHVAVFSDDMRDGLKGSVFEHEQKAFVSGKPGQEESVKFGIIAATQHPQVNYKKVNYSDAFYANQPAQCINYVSCHDNHTLYDRLSNSCPDATEEEKEKMARLALGIVLTSQGVPFLHAGSEFLRTKNGVENSYKSTDDINQMDWSRKKQHLTTVQFVQDLIKMRKAHPAFSIGTTEEITKYLHFMQTKNNFITYQIEGQYVGDSWKKIFVVLNGNGYAQKVKVPVGNWKFVVRDGKVNQTGFDRFGGGRMNIGPMEMIVLMQE